MFHWISRPLGLALALLALVAVLGAYQYRWLTEVSDAERDRVRAHLKQAAEDMAEAFNVEVTRLFVTFQTPFERFDPDPSSAIAAAFDEWQRSSPTPAIVETVYVVTAAGPGATLGLSRFDQVGRSLVPVDWPEKMALWRDRMSREGARFTPAMMADPIEASIPAVTVAVPHVKLMALDGENAAYVPDPSGPNHLVVVTLDVARLRQDLITPLVTRYFGDAASDYSLSIGSADDRDVVYSTSPDERAIAAAQADVAVGIFDLQPQGLSRLHADRAAHQKLSITIVRSARVADGRAALPGTPGAGAWQIRVRHRSGSLESLVARSRRRNLAISSAILSLLGVSVLLIVAMTDRRQRFADQQMQFVAAVSHELRTPLAVIRSAGENLADGVVTDAAQVRKYGALVRTEGRRLSDMVERVLAFAGLATRPVAVSSRGAVDLGCVTQEAAAALQDEAADRGVRVELHAPRGLIVSGDEAALRSALQNVLGNAVKYSNRGGAVRADVGRGDSRGRIVVSDTGLGIDAADVPHVWEPFFRGRRAIDAQVRGSGIGLSIVRQVVRSHDGDVRIDSRPGAGTTVVIELPLATSVDDRSARQVPA